MTKGARSRLFVVAASLVAQTVVWAQNIDVGEIEYLSSCAPCHGRNANGKGPLADQLKLPPSDLTQLAKKNGGVFSMNTLYEKIDGRQEVKAHGRREMPIWVRNLPDPEPVIRGRILSVIDYLNRIQEK